MTTGGRYTLATQTWIATTTTGAPEAKAAVSGVWTGTRMIRVGGRSGWNGQYTTQAGGLYDPVSDSWQPTTLVNAPSKRGGHVAVWTGAEMIIYARLRRHEHFLANGKRYLAPTVLTAGTYSGTITVSGPAATNSPQTVSVDLTVTE